jgi:hypothetical protein
MKEILTYLWAEPNLLRFCCEDCDFLESVKCLSKLKVRRADDFLVQYVRQSQRVGALLFLIAHQLFSLNYEYCTVLCIRRSYSYHLSRYNKMKLLMSSI